MKFFIATVALAGLFVCVASAEEQGLNATEVARYEELKKTLFGERQDLAIDTVLPMLKELKQLNFKELEKIPGFGEMRLPVWFGTAGEVRRLNDLLNLFIEAGQIDENNAKNWNYVRHLTYNINLEINDGVYYNIHPYLEKCVENWWAAFRKAMYMQN